jgi:hypothetical protein
MSDLQQINVLANNILQSSNNELRVETEKTLMALRDSKPNELVVLFINLLESNIFQSTTHSSCCFIYFLALI